MLLRWAVIIGCVSTEPGKNASALNWRPNPTGRMAKKKNIFPMGECHFVKTQSKMQRKKRAAWLENIYYFFKVETSFQCHFQIL